MKKPSGKTAARNSTEPQKGGIPLYERRVAIRHNTQVEAQVRALESQTWATVALVNLSRSGARFEGVLITVPGAMVVVKIALEDVNKDYELFGVVVWRSKGSFGVQFI